MRRNASVLAPVPGLREREVAGRNENQPGQFSVAVQSFGPDGMEVARKPHIMPLARDILRI
jgi:hypothetical protein